MPSVVDAAAKVLVAGKVFDLGNKDFMAYVIKVTNVGTSGITVNSRTDISTQVKVNGTVNGSVAVLPLTRRLNPGQSALIPVLWTGNVRPGDSVQFSGCVNLAGDTNTANNCDSVTLIASGYRITSAGARDSATAGRGRFTLCPPSSQGQTRKGRPIDAGFHRCGVSSPKGV